MNADYQDLIYKELTERIIKIFYRVYLRVSAKICVLINLIIRLFYK